MSSIKPPDGRPGSVVPTGQGRPETEAAERAGGPSFREALDQARAAGAAHADPAQASGAATAAGAADPIAGLASAVRSGALSPEQALEALVERAAGAAGAALSQAQRVELVAVLRHALDHDPALRELRDALG